MERIIVITSIIVSISLTASSQVTTAPSVFEVASVRLNKTGSRVSSMDFPKGGERFTATNMPVGPLILTAYDITVRQLPVQPFLPERYDIEAKAEHPVGRDEMLRMLQTLLVDRFKLVVHRETKEVPVYALTVGKGGPKLRLSDLPESEDPSPRLPSHAGGTESHPGGIELGTHYIFKNESMPDFAWALSKTVGTGDRVVVDNTGLKGNYDFELTIVRNTAPQAEADVIEPGLADPSVSSALEEQLGLKLESKKAAVKFLIIDHVEMPSEN